jgi:hypothetical protein
VKLANPHGGAASLGTPDSAKVTIADSGAAPQPQPQPEPKPSPDTTKPVVTSCGRAKQRIARQKSLLVCVKSSENGTAVVSGKLLVRGSRKPIALKRATAPVKAGLGRTLKLKIAKRDLRRLRHRTATARLTIEVRDGAGNASRLTRRVKARA